jgi:hypothetical protein
MCLLLECLQYGQSYLTNTCLLVLNSIVLRDFKLLQQDKQMLLLHVKQ